MDGMLIGLVRDALVRQYGEELWDALEGRGQSAEGAPSDSLACWLGRHAVPTLRETYPTLFSRHDSLRSFIRGLGDDLPVSRDRVAPSVPMRFQAVDTPDGQILLRVEADCALCALIQGVIAGAAIHYDERVTIHQIKSRKRGDNVCLFEIEVGEPASSPETDAFDLLAVVHA